MVDIDREVVELCRRFLAGHSRGAFDDPRLELHHADAYSFLEGSRETFDVVIVDVPDPLEEGPAYLLFTQEFYRLLKGRLNPGGLVVAQSGPSGPAFYDQCYSAVARTAGSVFPNVYTSEAFIPSFGTTWSSVVSSLGPNPTELAPEEVDRRLLERLTTELRYYDGVTHRGMFSVPKYLRGAVEAESRIITRANPLYVP